MDNNFDPIFEQYAGVDFADANPVAKVAALSKLQAAHSGKSRVVGQETIRQALKHP